MRRWRRWALAVALLPALLLALTLAAIVAGVSVDASRWRDSATRQASAALGRPVALQGALRLTLGRQLLLHVDDVHLPNPPGFKAPEFLSIGAATVAIDLLDLLRGTVRPRSIEARDVVLSLERAADGRTNWASATPRDSATPPPSLDIGPVRLQHVAVRYHDARAGTRHALDLESLTASSTAGGALTLAMRGRIDGMPMQELTLTAGPVRLLSDRTAPWPFDLQLTGPARLRATGVVDSGAGELRAEFEAATDDLQQAGTLLGLDLPPLGAAAVRGRAVARANAIQLARLEGRLPGAAVTGEIALALDAPRPQLTGALHIAEIDGAPLRAALAAARPTEARQRAGDWQAIVVRDLPALDADLALRVDRAVGLPIDVRAASLRLQLDASGLRAPLRATLAGIDVSGELRLDATTTMPTLSADLAASDQSVGLLAQDLLHMDGIDGTLGRLDLRVAGRGATLGAWARDAQASLALRGLTVRYRGSAGAAPVPVRVDRLQLDLGRGQALRGSASANVRGERVNLTLRGGQPVELLDTGSMPLTLDAAMPAAALSLGTRLGVHAGPTVLDFEARARRVGDLARWLDVAPDAALPIDVRGRLRFDEASWALADVSLDLGRSALSLNASGSRPHGATVSKAYVKVARLDLAELSSLRPAAAATAGRSTAATVHAEALPSMDIDVELAQVAVRRINLSDVRIVAQLRPGQMRASVLAGKLAAAPFDGVIALDLRGTPQGRIELAARDVDLGALLRGVQLAEVVEGRAGALNLVVQARGSSWDEVLADASLQASLRDAAVAVRTVPQRPVADVDIRAATIDAARGAPLRVQLDGAINAEPVQLQLQTGTLAELLGGGRKIPFALAAQVADSRLALDGTVALPLGTAAELRLQLGGERLDRLSQLALVDLPPWGPWSLAGAVRATATGYAMQDLEVRVGSSLLRGTGALDLGGPRPRLALQVAAPQLQLDDFPLPAQLSDPQAQPRQVGVLGAARDVAGRTDQLLAAQVLRTFDALVDVQADAMLAGERRLGGGALRLQLEAGRLSVDPAVLNLPGGNLRVSMTYDLKESDIDFAIAAEAQRFDYGVVVSRLGLGDDSQGLFSMRLNLAGTAPSLDSILRHANGTVDIAVWPNEMRSGMFRLWSVNVILTVLTLIDPQRPSRMNCIVGRFDFKDGLVSDDKLVIDTTALRVRGAGQIDLRSDTINAVFRPRAKGVALFRLQQPLRVSGTLTEQRFGIDARDTPGAIARLIFSPILWPIEQLTLGPLPRDGADVCTDPLRTTTP